MVMCSGDQMREIDILDLLMNLCNYTYGITFIIHVLSLKPGMHLEVWICVIVFVGVCVYVLVSA